jgi:hypothetical protein
VVVKAQHREVGDLVVRRIIVEVVNLDSLRAADAAHQVMFKENVCSDRRGDLGSCFHDGSIVRSLVAFHQPK